MSNEPIKYAIDISTGNTVFIDNAKNGRECECVCAECGEKMDAIQGEIREKHFRHIKESDCKGGQETILHKRAKEIIVENSVITLPAGTITYYGARKEVPLSKLITPDVTVYVDGLPLYFEIAVTNPKKKFEIEFYRSGKYKCIEIDLKGIAYDMPKELLKGIVLNEIKNKKEIYWTEKIKEKQSWLEQYFPVMLLISILILIYNLVNSGGNGTRIQQKRLRRHY